MRRYLSISFCALFLLFASCEDKEKSGSSDLDSPVKTQVKDEPGENEPQQQEQRDEDDSLKSAQVEKDSKEDALPLEQEELIPFLTKYGKENPENKIKISTRFGEIEVQLYNDTPLHRANFILLAKEGYFDGTFFHRVAKGFVIQGGNSDNPETSRKRNNIGSYLIPSEFEAGHRHTRGAFSAAKYAEQNVSKASSPFEFFIVQSERGAHHLNNDHTVFGRVTKGMDVVDEIAQQQVGEGEWPQINIHIEMEILD